MYQWTLVMTMIWATLATVNQSHVTLLSLLCLKLAVVCRLAVVFVKSTLVQVNRTCLSIRRQKQENKTDPLTKTGSKSFPGYNTPHMRILFSAFPADTFKRQRHMQTICLLNEDLDNGKSL